MKEAEAAVAMAPYDAFLRGDLSQVLILAGQPMRAVEWIDAAMANDPANAGYYNFLKGWALEVADKPEDALAALNEAADYWAVVPLFRAIVLVRLDRLDEARAEVNKALKMDPAFTQAKWREVTFYSDPSLVEREVADLAKAGLPED